MWRNWRVFIGAAVRFPETSLLVLGQPPACSSGDIPPKDKKTVVVITQLADSI